MSDNVRKGAEKQKNIRSGDREARLAAQLRANLKKRKIKKPVKTDTDTDAALPETNQN